MRKIILACLVLFLAIIPVASSAIGNISVSSTPTGASIFLDGVNTGSVTPATVEAVASGAHTILLRYDGYQDFSQSVNVVDNSTSVMSGSLSTVISLPTISGISPTSGYNNGYITGVTISGTNFAPGATTRLYMSGQTNISGVNTAYVSATQLTTDYNLNNAAPGTWTVIVVNSDGGIATGSAFTVTNSTAATVSSISPTSGTVNTTVTVTIVGTGFSTSGSTMHLYRSGYNDIVGSVSSRSATQLVGTFNLNSQSPGTWITRVYYDGTHTVDGPAFTINAAAPVNGTISFSTNPSGAGAYLNSVYQGKTPITISNVTPGTSYRILYQKSGYNDWSSTFTVTAGSTTDAYARLTAITTEATTAPTTIPTTIRPVVTTMKKPTTKTVTPWLSSTPPTQSPVDLVVILGAIGLGLIMLRKK